MDPTPISLEQSYSRVAGEYARRLFHELENKPLDRELLDRFAGQVRGRGPACDMGCGPGQIARYLRDRGVQMLGVDLAEGMVAKARNLNPDIPFFQGSMLGLNFPENSWAGIAAFYSIIHIPRPLVVQALEELKRVLKSGGVLLLAFHIGDQVVHLDEWWEKAVNMDFYFFQWEEMEDYLHTAGFTIEESLVRAPYANVEHPSRRGYLFARKPEPVTP